MHFIRYKPDSLNYLIPKFEPNRTSSSRDTAIFVVFYTPGTKKHEKVGYLWNYSSDPAQILGSSSWDCLTCILTSAFTPKSIPFSRKTGFQLEWQCPTLASLYRTRFIAHYSWAGPRLNGKGPYPRPKWLTLRARLYSKTTLWRPGLSQQGEPQYRVDFFP